MLNGIDDGSPTTDCRSKAIDGTLQWLNANMTSAQFTGTLTSYDTDGWTVTWTAASTTTAKRTPYIAWSRSYTDPTTFALPLADGTS